MNAPTRAAELADPKVELIPLTAIAPSETHIQEMRRARFTKEALQDLADSITKVGVLQAVVVRPLSALRGLAKYELVAGERRWLAAKIAGVAHLPCSIRTLNDEEVLEVQLIENLQREGLHELEEAEGYDALMKLKKVTADQLVDMVGKSRSYIYGRVKLLALCPEARKAFYAGELDASRALLIARIGHHDTQRQALNEVIGDKHHDAMSYRDAHQYILRNYMLELKAAPFDTKDPDLVPKAGDCQACPKRTGNQRDLFTDVKNPDVCTDPKCFATKREAHVVHEIHRLETLGKKVVHGEEAKKIFPGWERGQDYVHGGYVELTSTSWAGGKAQKVSEVLGKDFEPIIVVHPGNGKTYKLATQQAVSKAAAAKDPKRKTGDGAKPIPKRDDELEEQVTERIIAVLANKPLALDRQVLAHIVDLESEAWGHGMPDYLLTALKLSTSGQVKFDKLDAKVLTKLLVLGNVLEGLTQGYGTSEKFAEDVCKRFGVDAKKIRALIIEERKKEAAAKAAPKKGALSTAWPFATGSKPPIDAPKASAKKKPAGKAKGKKK